MKKQTVLTFLLTTFVYVNLSTASSSLISCELKLENVTQYSAPCLYFDAKNNICEEIGRREMSNVSFTFITSGENNNKEELIKKVVDQCLKGVPSSDNLRSIAFQVEGYVFERDLFCDFYSNKIECK